MTLQAGVISVVLAVLAIAPAQAQTPAIGAPCASAVGASTTFDDETHRRWYKRFWTGDCSGLWFCQSGAPNWNAGAKDFIARAEADKRAALTQRFCEVGHLIGREWARDNGVRKIDTNELSGFYDMLSSGEGDIDARLNRVEASARRMLAQ
jgi:hypothetical protein